MPSTEQTKEQLYREARRLGVKGRSKMNKGQLSAAVKRRAGKRGPERGSSTRGVRPKSSEEGSSMAMQVDMWTYREPAWSTSNLTGFGVEALDGSIGKIDDASYDVGAGYIVVDTGPWIFGKKVLLPAGVISRVDHDDEKVYVNRTKEQIKNAPEFNEDTYRDAGYRDQLGSYYGPGGSGYSA